MIRPLVDSRLERDYLLMFTCELVCGLQIELALERVLLCSCLCWLSKDPYWSPGPTNVCSRFPRSLSVSILLFNLHHKNSGKLTKKYELQPRGDAKNGNFGEGCTDWQDDNHDHCLESDKSRPGTFQANRIDRSNLQHYLWGKKSCWRRQKQFFPDFTTNKTPGNNPTEPRHKHCRKIDFLALKRKLESYISTIFSWYP